MADFCEDAQDLEDQVLSDCGGEEPGIVAAGYLEPEVDIYGSPDPSTAEFWNALIESSPKMVHIFRKTRGEKPKSTKVETEGFGYQKTRITSREHVSTFEFEGILDNRNLMNKINKRTNLRHFIVTYGGLLLISEKPVTIDGDFDIQRDIDGVSYFIVENTWSHKDIMLVYQAPEGIFTY